MVYVTAASVLVTALAAVIALRVPPPQLGDEAWERRLWDAAFAAIVPIGLLWLLCLASPSAGLRAFAAGWGVVAAQAGWLLRAARPGEDPGPGGGGGAPPEPPPDPPVDWAALERAAAGEPAELVGTR
jgi:4-amino-4-deoxy-L-arabinose transferase-like glycosyltransferase